MSKLLQTLIFVFLASITAFRLYANIAQPVSEWDELTNVRVLQETRIKHSFPVLYEDGKPFFEKPPLWYYTQLLSHVPPRILSATAGFALILLTVWVAYTWWGSIAAVTTWIILLATNHLFVTNPSGIFSTHTLWSADVDGLFILLLVAIVATTNHTLRGVFTGLAILTKGPLGILPFLFFPGSWRWIFITVIPWYLFMFAFFGIPFVSEHVGFHLMSRATSPVDGHNNPIWYYGQILTNRAFFPTWELLLLSLAWIVIKMKEARARKIAFITILLFIIPTIARTRLAWYILPMYPFAALSIGVALHDVVSKLHRSASKNSLNQKQIILSKKR